jgi:adenylate kinase|tara:strand:+ start:44 stop:694 length:651 start_codon:yes stop_codon:yes gene_type:complete
MNIVLFGPPGAGKGTQADYLVKNFSLHKISTGDFLREEINKKTNLGNEIKSFIDKGFFVSDEIINNLITSYLTSKKLFNNIIYDGYPRNVEQAKTLDKMLKKNDQKISCIFTLNVDKETVVKRIMGRIVCSKCASVFNKYFNPPEESNHICGSQYLNTRNDDNEETVVKRFDTYIKETLPILKYYKEHALLREIDGMAHISQINKEIRGIIETLGT